MANETGWVLLQQAEEHMKAGRRQAALPLLAAHLQKSPDSARGWWLLSLAVSETKQQIDCLERVLKIDPEYSPARTRLDKLKVNSTPKPVIPPFSAPIEIKPQSTPVNFPASETQAPIQRPVSSTKPAEALPNIPKKETTPRPSKKTNNQVVQFAVLGGMSLCAVAVLGFFVVLLVQGGNSITSPRLAQPNSDSVTQIMLPPTWTPTDVPTRVATQTALPTDTLMPVTPTLSIMQTSLAKAMTGPSIGYFAPDFSLTNVDSSSNVSLGQHNGRPVIVFFWATWCSFCEAEAPTLQMIYESYHADGLEILAVDVGESAGQARSYKKSHSLTYTVLDDPGEDVAAKYQVTSLPRLFFIDPSGKISYIGVGLMDYWKINSEVQEIMGNPQ